MISKKYIKGLGFKDLSEMFNYVCESFDNGQRDQFRRYVTKMSDKQYVQFNVYLANRKGVIL